MPLSFFMDKGECPNHNAPPACELLLISGLLPISANIKALPPVRGQR